jgi:alkylhydroperoxidase/carboxymuconolactone decarboxylase family protein YurZ
MPATLPEILLAPETQPQVIADSLALIDAELADKSGIAGNAVKLAYKTVSSFAPGYIRETVTKLQPEVADRLQPYWADFRASGGSAFGDYLAKRGDEVSQSLLSITDAMSDRSDKPVVVKAYRAVRGGAAKHIEAALPRLGDLVVKYAG